MGANNAIFTRVCVVHTALVNAQAYFIPGRHELGELGSPVPLVVVRSQNATLPCRREASRDGPHRRVLGDVGRGVESRPERVLSNARDVDKGPWQHGRVREEHKQLLVILACRVGPPRLPRVEFRLRRQVKVDGDVGSIRTRRWVEDALVSPSNIYRKCGLTESGEIKKRTKDRDRGNLRILACGRPCT